MQQGIKLEGKYLVTGAASGIGKATSIALAECGARIVLVDMNEEGLKKTFSEMSGNGHMIYPIDFSEQTDLSETIGAIVEQMGKLNGFVHCAGIAPVTPIATLTREKLEKVMAINYYSFLEMVRCISKKKYREENCNIVGVSSINSLYPEKCMTAYVASKAAVNAAVESLAIELAKNNIRINAVMPGIVNTPMTQRAFSEMEEENRNLKQRKQVLGTTEPEEVASIILFLLSDLSTAITGRTIYADGGYINF